MRERGRVSPMCCENNGETGEFGVWRKGGGREQRPGKMAQNEKTVNDKWRGGACWRARDMG